MPAVGGAGRGVTRHVINGQPPIIDIGSYYLGNGRAGPKFEMTNCKEKCFFFCGVFLFGPLPHAVTFFRGNSETFEYFQYF